VRPGEGPSFVDRRLEGAVEVVPTSTFERCTFRSVNLQGADLARCRFVACQFASCNLSVARVDGALLQDVAFVESKLAGLDWTTARRVSVVSFEQCVLDRCAFLAMDLRKTVMRGCRAHEAVFAEADLSGADLRDADLTGAHFARTKLTKADLRGARGYAIDPRENDVAGLRVSMPDAVALLAALGVDVTP
jgi:uncharacterized protein YjbI with pentapeptide repeats